MFGIHWDMLESVAFIVLLEKLVQETWLGCLELCAELSDVGLFGMNIGPSFRVQFNVHSFLSS